MAAAHKHQAVRPRSWVREKRKEARRASDSRQLWRMLSGQPARATGADEASGDPHAFLLDAAPLAAPPLASGCGCNTTHVWRR